MHPSNAASRGNLQPFLDVQVPSTNLLTPKFDLLPTLTVSLFSVALKRTGLKIKITSSYLKQEIICYSYFMFAALKGSTKREHIVDMKSDAPKIIYWMHHKNALFCGPYAIMKLSASGSYKAIALSHMQAVVSCACNLLPFLIHDSAFSNSIYLKAEGPKTETETADCARIAVGLITHSTDNFVG